MELKQKDNNDDEESNEVHSDIESGIMPQFDDLSKDNNKHKFNNQSNLSFSKDNSNTNNNESSLFEKKENKQKEKTEKNLDKNDLPSLTSSQTKKTIDSICLFVFLNYSNFDFEERDFLISYQTMRRLFFLTGILSSIKENKSNAIQLKQFDLILKKISPKKVSRMNSTQFFNLIVLLASKEQKKDFANNPKQALLSFVQKHLSPIIIKIKNRLNPNIPSLYYSIEKKINEMTKSMIDTNSLLLMKSQYKSIMLLYKLYFSFELFYKSSDKMQFLIKDSLKHLIELSKNYALSPVLLSIEKVAIIYNCIIDQPNTNTLIQFEQSDIGEVFTLLTFYRFLLHASDIIFENETEFLYERIIMLFKRMETSNGYVLTLSKTHIGSNENFTLAINESIINKITSKTVNTQTISNYEQATTTIKTNEGEDTNIAHNSKKTKHNTVASDIISKNEETYNELLEEFFETYATIGEKMNFSQMTLTSFLKLIRDFGVFEIKNPKLNL